MNREPSPAPARSAHFSARLAVAFGHPAVDKTIAVIACVPFALVLIANAAQHSLSLPRLVLMAHMALQIVPMFLRAAPVRVSVNPTFWLLAFAATYWPFLVVGLTGHGHLIMAEWLVDTISLSSLVVAAYARLSLGRSIGFVPAQRRLVMDGAYRFVRHPIYSGIFLAYLGFALRDYTPVNAGLIAIGALLFMVKSIAEERFLAQDPSYAEYLQQVRHRWIPGLL